VTRRNSSSLLVFTSLSPSPMPLFTLPSPTSLSTFHHPSSVLHLLPGGNLGRRDDRDGNDDISIASQDGAARCVVCVALSCVFSVPCHVLPFHDILRTLSSSHLSSRNPLLPLLHVLLCTTARHHYLLYPILSSLLPLQAHRTAVCCVPHRAPPPHHAVRTIRPSLSLTALNRVASPPASARTA
jgi:hypothetical protein